MSFNLESPAKRRRIDENSRNQALNVVNSGYYDEFENSRDHNVNFNNHNVNNSNNMYKERNINYARVADGLNISLHSTGYSGNRISEKESRDNLSRDSIERLVKALEKMLPVTLIGTKSEKIIYALLDEGSTVTLINSRIIEEIGRKKSQCNVGYGG